MRIGVSLRSGYPPTDPRTGARWMVERAAAAQRAGLASLFVGDHHSTGAERPYYQNAAILGRLLAEWDTGSVPERQAGSVPERRAGSVPERKAGALFLLPLWHPVLAAELIGTLASIAPCPFVLQTAIGGGAAQFAAMGVPLQGRTARFEAALDVVRRLLAGEVVSDPDGRSGHRFTDAQIAPCTPAPLEVWIGAVAPAAIDRAVSLGDGWLAPPEVVPAAAAELVGIYRERCAAHGRDPGAVAVRRDVHVGVDAASAQAVAEPVIAGGYRGFDRDAFVVGDVDEVTAHVRELAAMGFTEVLFRQLAAEQRDALESIDRLGEVAERVADD